MNRITLLLDEDLLERATREFGVKTYSAAVNLALAEVLRVRKVQNIAGFFGSGIWEGNLPEMREDRKHTHPLNSRRRR